MVVPPPRRKKEGGAKNGVSMYMKLAEAVSEILQTDGKTEIIQRYTGCLKKCIFFFGFFAYETSF